MSSSRSSTLSWLSCHCNPKPALESLNHVWWCCHLLLLQPSNQAAVTLHIHGMQWESSSYDPGHLFSRASQSTAGFLCLDTFFKGSAIAHHRATKTTPSERPTVVGFFLIVARSILSSTQYRCAWSTPLLRWQQGHLRACLPISASARNWFFGKNHHSPLLNWQNMLWNSPTMTHLSQPLLQTQNKAFPQPLLLPPSDKAPGALHQGWVKEASRLSTWP